MTGPRSSPSLDAHSPTESNIRKRVCKACDRCRLKKSKCDGTNPCSRCKTDNAICVFGERKKAHDKVYPKGYVEMLEQQQGQLVIGLQELYKRTLEGQGWPGAPLTAAPNGHPLTHDILERLGALNQDGQTEGEPFEEDLDRAQERLIANGAAMVQRHDSSDESASGSPTFRPSGTISETMFPTAPVSVSKFPPTPNYTPFSHLQQVTRPMQVQPVQRHSFPVAQPQSQAHAFGQPHRVSDPNRILRPQPHAYPPRQQPSMPTVGQLFLQSSQTAVSHDVNMHPRQHQQPSQPPQQLQHPHQQEQNIRRQPSWGQLSESSTLDDSLSIFRGLDTPSFPIDNFDFLNRPTQPSRHQPQAGLNACLGQPDWNDEDLKAFFGHSPSLLS